MADFFKIFPKRHVLLPVIHALDMKQVIENVDIARNEGADGVFLINMDPAQLPARKLIQIYEVVRVKHPDFWIGFNFLDLELLSAMKNLPLDAGGLWTDDAGIEEEASGQGFVADKAAFCTQRRAENHYLENGLYFGGVAFKYKKHVRDKDLGTVAKLAMTHVDVVTTSGDATGSPPSIEKIAAICNAIGPTKAFAVASGITKENIPDYRYVNALLVGSSLTEVHSEVFYPAEVRAMVRELERMYS